MISKSSFSSYQPNAYPAQHEQNNIIGPMTELLQQPCEPCEPNDNPLSENPIDTLALVLNDNPEGEFSEQAFYSRLFLIIFNEMIVDQNAVKEPVILPDIFEPTSESNQPLFSTVAENVQICPTFEEPTDFSTQATQSKTTNPDSLNENVSKKKKRKIVEISDTPVKKSRPRHRIRKKKPEGLLVQKLVLDQSEIDDIAEVKEITKIEVKKNKISLSEKYLVDTAKEKVTGQSKLSNSQISDKNLGRYFCKECNKSYNRKNDLDRHIMTHTGEKPFKCEKCSAGFSLKSSLTKHSRTHSNDKIET